MEAVSIIYGKGKNDIKKKKEPRGWESRRLQRRKLYGSNDTVITVMSASRGWM